MHIHFMRYKYNAYMYKYKVVCLAKIDEFYHKQLYDTYFISYGLYKNNYVWKT
jgi:hypothetical protein